MDLSVSSVVSIAGILVALVIYFLDLRKKINTLLEREMGVLTAVQAKALVDLYLKAVKHELDMQIIPFIRYDFPQCVEQTNYGAADRFAGQSRR